jgi:hypothetical protein
MGFDHDRAPSGDRGGGVSAQNPEREREVGGSEDRNRPDRDRNRDNVVRFTPPGRGRIVGVKAQLAGCALQFPTQARLGQPGFGADDLDNLVGAGFLLGGTAVKRITTHDGQASWRG